MGSQGAACLCKKPETWWWNPSVQEATAEKKGTFKKYQQTKTQDVQNVHETNRPLGDTMKIATLGQ